MFFKLTKTKMDVSNIIIKTKNMSDMNNNTWDIIDDDYRIIIKSQDLFTCFITRAFEFKTKKSMISAHMLIHTHDNNNLSKVQYWNPDILEDEDIVLEKILEDLSNFEKYYNKTYD